MRMCKYADDDPMNFLSICTSAHLHICTSIFYNSLLLSLRFRILSTTALRFHYPTLFHSLSCVCRGQPVCYWLAAYPPFCYLLPCPAVSSRRYSTYSILVFEQFQLSYVCYQLQTPDQLLFLPGNWPRQQQDCHYCKQRNRLLFYFG